MLGSCGRVDVARAAAEAYPGGARCGEGDGQCSWRVELAWDGAYDLVSLPLPIAAWGGGCTEEERYSIYAELGVEG